MPGWKRKTVVEPLVPTSIPGNGLAQKQNLASQHPEEKNIELQTVQKEKGEDISVKKNLWALEKNSRRDGTKGKHQTTREKTMRNLEKKKTLA